MRLGYSTTIIIMNEDLVRDESSKYSTSIKEGGYSTIFIVFLVQH